MVTTNHHVTGLVGTSSPDVPFIFPWIHNPFPGFPVEFQWLEPVTMDYYMNNIYMCVCVWSININIIIDIWLLLIYDYSYINIHTYIYIYILSYINNYYWNNHYWWIILSPSHQFPWASMAFGPAMPSAPSAKQHGPKRREANGEFRRRRWDCSPEKKNIGKPIRKMGKPIGKWSFTLW